MSSRMRRAVVPLLAAPMALVFCAGSAAAIDVRPDYVERPTQTDYLTRAICYHPTDNRLGFDVEITTGKEVNPEGADVSRFILQARDNGAGDDFQDSTVFAKRLSWSYGILTPDGRAFEPTSATFVDGSGFRRNGEVGSRFNATDVMAMQFKAVWSVVGAAATRTLTCTVRLDKFRYYPKYVLQPSS